MIFFVPFLLTFTDPISGLRDINAAKVKMTENYIFQSQNIFVVVPIGRAITAETVKSSLAGALSQNVSLGLDRVAQYFNVGVICTHSDVSFLFKVFSYKLMLDSKSMLKTPSMNCSPKVAREASRRVKSISYRKSLALL